MRNAIARTHDAESSYAVLNVLRTSVITDVCYLLLHANGSATCGNSFWTLRCGNYQHILQSHYRRDSAMKQSILTIYWTLETLQIGHLEEYLRWTW